MQTGKVRVGAGNRTGGTKFSVEPISKEYLNRVLTSPKFVSHLGLALQKSEGSGKEYGFIISKDISSGLTTIGKVSIGDQGGVRLSSEEHWEEVRKLFPGKIFFYLGELHIHPAHSAGELTSVHMIQVSGDLIATNSRGEINRKDFGYNLPSISMIAQQNGNMVRILVYREPITRPTSEREFAEVAHSVDNELERATSQGEVTDVLKSFGYEVMVLRARTSGEIYREDALKFADTFAFEPRAVKPK
jgi:hypothetical protein